MVSYEERELGYRFEPFADPHAVGHRSLAVNIYSVPTEQHFDPDHVIAPTVDSGGTITHTTLVHPWHGKEHYQIAFGNIYIRDRKGKVIEAFTLGGRMQISAAEGHTHCRITSSAPIFHLASAVGVSDDSHDTVIVNEIEALFAKRRVHWLRDDTGYEQRLTSLDPRVLYVASLKAVGDQLDSMPSLGRGEHYYETVHRLHTALAAMVSQGVNLEQIPDFETLI